MIAKTGILILQNKRELFAIFERLIFLLLKNCVVTSSILTPLLRLGLLYTVINFKISLNIHCRITLATRFYFRLNEQLKIKVFSGLIKPGVFGENVFPEDLWSWLSYVIRIDVSNSVLKVLSAVHTVCRGGRKHSLFRRHTRLKGTQGLAYYYWFIY